MLLVNPPVLEPGAKPAQYVYTTSFSQHFDHLMKASEPGAAPTHGNMSVSLGLPRTLGQERGKFLIQHTVDSYYETSLYTQDHPATRQLARA